jgi:hypothetical protein
MSIAKLRAGKAGLSSVLAVACGAGDGSLAANRKCARGLVRVLSSVHDWLVPYAFGVAACEPAYMNWPDEPQRETQAVRSGNRRGC